MIAMTMAAAAMQLHMNITSSIPVGLYQSHTVSSGGVVSRGTLVLVCPAVAAARMARERGYLGRGACAGDVMPIGKQVAAIAGDTVLATVAEVRVNGRVLRNSRAYPTDHQGRPLVHVPQGMYVLPPHTVWLTGESSKSWDSRYFGPLPTTAILATLTPVWTVGSSRLAPPALLRGS